MAERPMDISKLNFESFRGLTEDIIATGIVDDETGNLVMIGFMNRTALEKTLETGEVWFWSRSRKELWDKGAISGDRFLLRRIAMNCNKDALKIYVERTGSGCHTGTGSCFESPAIEEDKERI